MSHSSVPVTVLSHQHPKGGNSLGRLQLKEPLLTAPASCCTTWELERVEVFIKALRLSPCSLASFTEYQEKDVQRRRRTSLPKAKRLLRHRSKCCVPIDMSHHSGCTASEEKAVITREVQKDAILYGNG